MHGGAAGRYSDDNVELDDELGPEDAFDGEGFEEGQVCRFSEGTGTGWVNC